MAGTMDIAFHQDNAPVHTGRIIDQWFENHERKKLNRSAQ